MFKSSSIDGVEHTPFYDRLSTTLTQWLNLECYVGTSGWFYSWNEGGSLDWYVSNSGLNAVELNASFYRFPYPNMVKSWAGKCGGLRWSVKVNRLVTHTFKFNDRAFDSWEKFRNLFKPLDPKIDFYLFQLPPSTTPKSAPAIERFFERTKLKERFALEVRNQKWFVKEWLDWASRLGLTWVSIDSPDFTLQVYNTNGLVYERMHGRSEWYSHLYSDEELQDVAGRVLEAKPRRAYIFFNNNHAMLMNSRKMLDILRNMQ